MTSIYDNWERLVHAALDREKLRELARETSFSSSISSSFNSAYDFQFDSVPDCVSGSLTDQVIKAADDAATLKEECAELKSKAEKLAGLLRQVTHMGNNYYDRPTRRIIPDTELVLAKVLKLLLKCSAQGMRRIFTMIPTVAFRKMSSQLENSIYDVTWLLRISSPTSNYEYLGLPSIAVNEPILCLIWEQIAILYTGSLDDRTDAAASLVSLARDNHRYAKLIIEEDGVRPLLKLVREGTIEGQEIAASAIGWLGKGPESVEHMIDSGVCQVFVEMLEQGPVKVQASVAWAVSELAAHHPKCQHVFAQHDIIQLLVSHLAFVASLSPSGEMDDPSTKTYKKAMAARALCHLAKGNSPICRSITESSRALFFFSILLEEGPEEVQYNSAMALMEITAVAEEDVELRTSAFNPNSPTCKAVVDQLLRVVEKADSELLTTCIKTIGNLATIFKANESTRIISPLVKLLDEREVDVHREACIALTKFVHSENALCVDHSKAIIGAGGVKHLMEILYFGDERVANSALILLCYIALHMPDSEQLAPVEVLIVLEWAWQKSSLRGVKDVETFLSEAKERLKLCHSRRSRRYR